MPRGDPAQARLRRGPLQPRQRPARTRASPTRPSPSTARRSGSSPTSPRPTATSAIALRGQGKLDEAIAEYREAIRLKPDFAEAHTNLGDALHRPGQTATRPSPNYREAIRLKPDVAEAHGNLGNVLCEASSTTRRHRRVPRGDPPQARPRRGPRNLGIALGTRASSTRPSPNSARRSGSSPTSPRPTATSASP